MTIGEHLRRLRGQRTITDVAADLGLHRTTISRHERGEREPDLATLNLLLDHYGATDGDRLAVLGAAGQHDDETGEAA
jgi:transcriptional regulator with XRE-family HTH domain